MYSFSALALVLASSLAVAGDGFLIHKMEGSRSVGQISFSVTKENSLNRWFCEDKPWETGSRQFERPGLGYSLGLTASYLLEPADGEISGLKLAMSPGLEAAFIAVTRKLSPIDRGKSATRTDAPKANVFGLPAPTFDRLPGERNPYPFVEDSVRITVRGLFNCSCFIVMDDPKNVTVAEPLYVVGNKVLPLVESPVVPELPDIFKRPE